MKKLIFAALVLPSVFAASAADWRGRSIYQVVTDRFARTDNSTTASCSNLNDYCGGSWQGIINRLDYIQNMGFTAVWISPVTQQATYQLTNDGNSYHGYWQNNLYALNTKFGTADDLKKLSAALHARGMYLMVDIVVNHFAWPGAANAVDYSTYNPFNNAEYFHPYCPIDYNNATSLKDCWMGSSNVELTDLNTTRSDVRSMYQSWIKNLVSTYSIDGLRIDTCLEVESDFFPDFISAAGVYAVCEADNGDPAVVEPYQKAAGGVLNYPLYYPITQAFESTSGSISNLVKNVNTIKNGFQDSTLIAPFTENHDQPRFPSYTSDIALAENAIAFGMLADGPPIIYQGQEQHYSGGSVPANRETVWTSGFNTNAQLRSAVAKSNACNFSSSAVAPGHDVGYDAH